MTLGTALIPLPFTNNHVNNPPDISVSVKPLPHARYVSTIKSSTDGLGLDDVITKFSANFPNSLEVERLCVHTVW